LTAGVLSGLFGIDGGVIVGLEQRTAMGTSLAALPLPVGLLGVMTCARAAWVGVIGAKDLATIKFVGCL
jgi:uncharacterized protein